jgi:hypothetical protein
MPIHLHLLSVFDASQPLEPDAVLVSCATILKIVISGPAGRDAFLLLLSIFGGLMSNDRLVKSLSNLLRRSLLRARHLAVASIVITLDGECFPSRVKLLQACLVPDAEFLGAIMMSFDHSPFVEKSRHMRSLYIEGPLIVVTLVRALRSRE